MVSKRQGTILAAALLIVATGGGVLAHGGATGVVKERMDLMSALGDSMKALKSEVMGGAPDRDAVARQAARIVDHVEALPDKFPEGSVEAPSEAKPAIWERWSDFEESADALSAAARELAETADSAALRARFAAVGKTCSSCHSDFRAKK